MIFDLDSDNRTNYEEQFNHCENKDSDIDNVFDPFFLVGAIDGEFDEDLNTSSYLEHLISELFQS